MGVIAIMGIGALISGFAMASGYLNLLQFVTHLSFIKMAVTLLKYIPQRIKDYLTLFYALQPQDPDEKGCMTINFCD
ncbi:unnamed protein product [Cylicostephanus goldi]|uniref:Uncharacterized protein n=1 Tax=Cylicostephanus goldi TaxID=71465 RepID=A0A3P6RJU0_CYLGO|nr:unnamed protein product [Cylicostephanus goldi]